MRKVIRNSIAEVVLLSGIYSAFSFVARDLNPLEYHVFWRATFAIIVLGFLYNWLDTFASKGK